MPCTAQSQSNRQTEMWHSEDTDELNTSDIPFFNNEDDEDGEATATRTLTVNDLVIDETLSDIERVRQFARSPVALQRLVHVRLLSETASEIGVARAHKEGLFDLATVYLGDMEFVVRRHLALEVRRLITLCAREASWEDADDQETEYQSDIDEHQFRHRDTISTDLSVESGARMRNRGSTSETDDVHVNQHNDTDDDGDGDEDCATETTETTRTRTSTITTEVPPYSLVLDTLLPVLGRLVTDPEPSVRAAACDALANVTSLIHPDDHMEHILSIALICANDHEEEDIRMTAAALLNLLAPLLNQDLCEQFIVPVIIALSDDPAFRVRKTVALHMAEVIGVCSEELIDKRMLPAFLNLTRDSIWGVRKACAESIYAVTQVVVVQTKRRRRSTTTTTTATQCTNSMIAASSSNQIINDTSIRGTKIIDAQSNDRGAVAATDASSYNYANADPASVDQEIPNNSASNSRTSDIRTSKTDNDNNDNNADDNYSNTTTTTNATAVQQQLLIEVVDRLINDESKWVKIAMYQNLGPFIASLHTTSITPALLSAYLQMGHTTTLGNAETRQLEMNFYCAYSLPGVLLAVGRARWEEEVSETFDRLARDNRWRVRRTVACGMHEVAKVLGSDIAERDLLAPFELLLKDLDDVKLGIVEHLGEFLKCLTPSCRESYLPLMSDLQSDATPQRWRLRQLIAQQLSELCNLFSAPSTFSVVTSLVFNACEDDVSAVRHAGFIAVPTLILRLHEHDVRWPNRSLERILRWATHERFDLRQRFVRVCCYLFGGGDCNDKDSDGTGIEEDLLDDTLARRTVICSDAEQLRHVLPQLDKMLLPDLLNLGKNDPVANVRITFAISVRQCAFLSALPTCQSVLMALQVDSDRDVVIAAGGTEADWWVKHGETITDCQRQASAELERVREALLNGPGYDAPPSPPPSAAHNVADMV